MEPVLFADGLDLSDVNNRNSHSRDNPAKTPAYNSQDSMTDHTLILRLIELIVTPSSAICNRDLD